MLSRALLLFIHGVGDQCIVIVGSQNLQENLRWLLYIERNSKRRNVKIAFTKPERDYFCGEYKLFLDKWLECNCVGVLSDRGVNLSSVTRSASLKGLYWTYLGNNRLKLVTYAALAL